MKHFTLLCGLFLMFHSKAQVGVVLLKDTLETVEVSSEAGQKNLDTPDATRGVEETLQVRPDIDLIQRGGYASEVVYRGLSSNQAPILIDGMRVYGACTDKMDPATSYVERSNLMALERDAVSTTGLHGLNLTFRKGTFRDSSRLDGGVQSSILNNGLKARLASQLRWSSSKHWLVTTVSYEDASNYRDGNGDEVRYTQFSKLNTYVSSGHKLGKRGVLSFTLLSDRARDIGYAALPMDVSNADAMMLRASYSWQNHSLRISNSLYANDVVHVMDDTQRDSVAMHMDMPGWSRTYGLTGEVKRILDRSIWSIMYEMVMNERKAEMTMYAPGFDPMYMETWPKVRRTFVSITPRWSHYINDKYAVKLEGSFTLNSDDVLEPFGRQQLEIIGYDATEPIVNSAKTVRAELSRSGFIWSQFIALKAGDRLPELSERFGFYLFNSQDGFDYLGTPDLVNERFASIEYNLSASFSSIRLNWNSYGYAFDEYIFGIQRPDFFAMTIGANGVKEYQNTGSAHIFGSDLNAYFFETSQFPAYASVGYRYGYSSTIGYLPQMAPITARFAQRFTIDWFEAQVDVLYANQYDRASLEFGEQNVPAYWLLNASTTFKKTFTKSNLSLRLMVNNALNKFYSTHMTWGAIPLPGRGLGMSLEFRF